MLKRGLNSAWRGAGNADSGMEVNAEGKDWPPVGNSGERRGTSRKLILLYAPEIGRGDTTINDDRLESIVPGRTYNFYHLYSGHDPARGISRRADRSAEKGGELKIAVIARDPPPESQNRAFRDPGRRHRA